MFNMDVISTFITEREIQDEVKTLGKQISKDYANEKLVLVGVLKGAVVFYADLLRQIRNVRIRCEFVELASYNGTESSGRVRTVKGLGGDLHDSHVLIVEDIVDTGRTLNHLLSEVEVLCPKSIKVCCLLDKASKREISVPVEYVGFEIPDIFVVGYGLDADQAYRNIPSIGYIPTTNFSKLVAPFRNFIRRARGSTRSIQAFTERIKRGTAYLRGQRS